jgi:hypothetical protein
VKVLLFQFLLLQQQLIETDERRRLSRVANRLVNFCTFRLSPGVLDGLNPGFAIALRLGSQFIGALTVSAERDGETILRQLIKRSA